MPKTVYNELELVKRLWEIAFDNLQDARKVLKDAERDYYAAYEVLCRARVAVGEIENGRD